MPQLIKLVISGRFGNSSERNGRANEGFGGVEKRGETQWFWLVVFVFYMYVCFVQSFFWFFLPMFVGFAVVSQICLFFFQKLGVVVGFVLVC